jgi:hypothetical protein
MIYEKYITDMCPGKKAYEMWLRRTDPLHSISPTLMAITKCPSVS